MFHPHSMQCWAALFYKNIALKVFNLTILVQIHAPQTMSCEFNTTKAMNTN